MEGSRDAIWSWTVDGTIKSWNAEAERMFDYKADEILGKSILTLIPSDRIKLAHDIIAKVSRGQTFAPWETIRLRKDGTPVNVELSVFPTHDTERQLVGAATICRDIAIRKQADARIAADLRDMTALNELSAQLVRSGVELNENLRAILEIAINVTQAQKANVQLLNAANETLAIAAGIGFELPLPSFFDHVLEGAPAYSLAMLAGSRVEVEDVTTSELFTGKPTRDLLLKADIHAVASTPLLDSNGKLLGAISVYFEKPHRITERERGFIDLLARLTADYLERLQAEQIARTLVREVQHRANNLLAVVQTIASRSLSGDYSLAEARTAFESRLQALARTTRHVTKANWAGVNLKDIVTAELEPFSERAIIEGDNVSLDPKQAQDMSLALHELATNAAKHGALSNGTGTVRISWVQSPHSDSSSLSFIWRESGGPPVTAPNRSGFGTALLKATFPRSRATYASDGLCFEVEFELGRAQA